MKLNLRNYEFSGYETDVFICISFLNCQCFKVLCLFLMDQRKQRGLTTNGALLDSKAKAEI